MGRVSSSELGGGGGGGEGGGGGNWKEIDGELVPSLGNSLGLGGLGVVSGLASSASIVVSLRDGDGD